MCAKSFVLIVSNGKVYEPVLVWLIYIVRCCTVLIKKQNYDII